MTRAWRLRKQHEAELMAAEFGKMFTGERPVAPAQLNGGSATKQPAVQSNPLATAMDASLLRK